MDGIDDIVLRIGNVDDTVGMFAHTECSENLITYLTEAHGTKLLTYQSVFFNFSFSSHQTQSQISF